MTSASIASLAKSTPSISSDLLKERSPLSFTVLPSSSLDYTYQHHHHNIPPIASPYKPTLSCSSLANFTWTSQPVPATTIASVLRQNFGNPDDIKPIVSALEYPQSPAAPVKIIPFKIPSPPPPPPIDTFNRTLERYNKFVEKQKMQLELQQQQQQADFLSLSLSPPMNRRHKEMMALKGSFVSL